MSHKMERLGIPFLKDAAKDVAYWWKRNRRLTGELFRTVPFGDERRRKRRRICGRSCAGQAGRRFLEEGIEHIHAPWANGPATRSGIASPDWHSVQLHNAPGTFTLLTAPSREDPDATFIKAKQWPISLLVCVCRMGVEKMHLTYNGVPLQTGVKRRSR